MNLTDLMNAQRLNTKRLDILLENHKLAVFNRNGVTEGKLRDELHSILDVMLDTSISIIEETRK